MNSHKAFSKGGGVYYQLSILFTAILFVIGGCATMPPMSYEQALEEMGAKPADQLPPDFWKPNESVVVEFYCNKAMLDIMMFSRKKKWQESKEIARGISENTGLRNETAFWDFVKANLATKLQFAEGAKVEYFITPTEQMQEHGPGEMIPSDKYVNISLYFELWEDIGVKATDFIPIVGSVARKVGEGAYQLKLRANGIVMTGEDAAKTYKKYYQSMSPAKQMTQEEMGGWRGANTRLEEYKKWKDAKILKGMYASPLFELGSGFMPLEGWARNENQTVESTYSTMLQEMSKKINSELIMPSK